MANIYATEISMSTMFSHHGHIIQPRSCALAVIDHTNNTIILQEELSPPFEIIRQAEKQRTLLFILAKALGFRP
ncbi:hypothetical protein DVH24_034905 [Malus domestica]|uniref:Uncharacterized protein n=1 Tax=Malus domestica TaxID=3750 RepID=A0A498IH58_MALDO|nr:hypothetical protein DVH24_034905 [Malus domestica]